jgi:DNA ligase-1
MSTLIGKEHLKEYFDVIVAKGGEGIVLREPNSVYKVGRSKSMRKYKEFFDTEVKVIENVYPHGLHCLQTNDKKVFVSIYDNYEEAKKLKEGAIITIKHSGVNAYGLSLQPKFYRERTDVTWNDLINA